jgi:flagellar M-ring protein FliF
MQDVTIVDQHGVALTRPADRGEGGEGGSSRLDVKRELENYLSHKVGAVLERAFGPGQGIASVDVSLNMDRVRLTQESVLGAPGGAGQPGGGAVSRERQVTQAGAAPLGEAADAASGGNSEREVEYQLGRRVEQIVSQPGSIQQIQVVALVRKPLDAEQVERLKRVVAAAAGTSSSRGDTVEVQAIDAAAASLPGLPGAAFGAPEDAVPAAAAQGAVAADGGADRVTIVLASLLAAAAAGYLGLRQRARRQAPALTMEERAAALRQLRLWLHEEKREDVA